MENSIYCKLIFYKHFYIKYIKNFRLYYIVKNYFFPFKIKKLNNYTYQIILIKIKLDQAYNI